jgi:hypothetical protein
MILRKDQFGIGLVAILVFTVILLASDRHDDRLGGISQVHRTGDRGKAGSLYWGNGNIQVAEYTPD